MGPTSDPAAPPPVRGWPPAARAGLFILGGALALLLVLGFLLVTPWGATTIARLTLRMLQPVPGARIDAQYVSGLAGALEVRGVTITRTDGRVIARADTLRLEYRLGELMGAGHRGRRLKATGPWVDIAHWPPLTPKPANKKSATPRFAVDAIEIRHGGVELRTPPAAQDTLWTASDIAVQARGLAFGDSGLSVVFDAATLTFGPRAAPPTTFQVAAHGRLDPSGVHEARVTIEGDSTHIVAEGTLGLPKSGPALAGTELRLQATPFAERDFRRLIATDANPGNIMLDARVGGAGDSLAARGTAHTTRGGRLTFDARRVAPPGAFALRADANAEALDIGSILGRPRGTFVLEGRVTTDLRGPDHEHLSGPLDVVFDGSTLLGRECETVQVHARLDQGRVSLTADADADDYVIAVRGTGTPFAHPPVTDLVATLTIPPIDGHGAAPAAGAPAWVAGELTAELHARGKSLADAAATLGLTMRPDPAAAPLLGAGRLDAALAGGTTRWSLESDVSHGHLRASGDLRTVRDDLAYAIRSGDARGIDLAPLLGDTLATRLDAAFTLNGQGMNLATVRAQASLTELAIARGNHRLTSHAVLTLRDARAGLTTKAELDGAALDATASLAPVADPRATARLALGFKALDLARITGDTTWTSDLAGRLDAAVRLSDVTLIAKALREPVAVPPGVRGSAKLSLAPSTWRGQDVGTFELGATLDGPLATLAGRLSSDFGNATLTGTAHPFADPPALQLEPLTLQRLNLGAMLGRASLATRLNGRIDIDAAGRDLHSLTATVRAALDGSRVNRTTFDRLGADGRFAGGELEARIDARSATDSVAATVAGTGLGVAGMTPRLTAHGRARSNDIGAWLGRDSLDAAATLAFDVAAHGDSTNGTLTAASGTVFGRARINGAVVDTVRSRFSVSHGHVDVEPLELRSSAGDVLASGHIALRDAAPGDSTNFHLTGTLADLEPLAQTLGLERLYAKRGGFSAIAHGTRAHTRVSGEVHGSRIGVNDVRTDSLLLTFEGAMRDSALTAMEGRLTMEGLLAAGLPSRDLVATGSWDGKEIALEARSDIDEGRWQELAFRLTPTRPRMHATIERFKFVRVKSTLSLQKPADIEFGDILRIDDLVVLQNGTPRVRVDGAVDTAGRADLRLSVDSLEVADYLDLMGVTNLSGRLSMDAGLSGTPRRPVVDGTWRANLKAGKAPSRLNGRLHWADGELSVAALFEQKPGQQITWNTRLPLILNLLPPPGTPVLAAGGATLGDTLEARGFDIGWFGPMIAPEQARDLKGRLDGRVISTGDLMFPRVSGALDLTGAGVAVPSLGTRYHCDRIALQFKDRTITVAPSVIKSGNGTLNASGHATFEGRGRRSFQLDTRLKHFSVVNTAQITLELNGTLAASGLTSSPRVEGSLELVKSTVRVGGSTAERKVEKVVLTEADRRDLDDRFSDPMRSPMDPMALVDSVEVDVTTRIGTGVWVRRETDPVVALEMSGQVRTRKPRGGTLTASGQIAVQTGRSYLSYLGRRFEMTQASVVLPGPIDSASAELEARYDGSGTSSKSAPEVTAHVSVSNLGTNIELRSVPYMDRAALINYLTTGETQGEMASGTAAGLAVGSVIGALGGSAGRSLGFQVVQVTQDAYGGQTLSAGNYVDPRLYLGFRQPVVQGQSANTNSEHTTYTTEFEVEVEMAKYLLFNVQGGGSQYRFLLRPRLGK